MKLRIDRLGSELGLILPPNLSKRLGVGPGDWIDADIESSGGIVLSAPFRSTSGSEHPVEQADQIDDPAEREG